MTGLLFSDDFLIKPKESANVIAPALAKVSSASTVLESLAPAVFRDGSLSVLP